MANAKKDDNQVSTATALSNADGSTILNLQANPSTHVLDVSDASTGSDAGGDHGVRDDNMIPVLMAVSESDGVTPVPLYIDSATDNLLIDSN